MGEQEEWKVTWFPLPRFSSMVRFGNEEKVRRIAADPDVAEWYPILEKRTVTVGPWEITP